MDAASGGRRGAFPRVVRGCLSKTAFTSRRQAIGALRDHGAPDGLQPYRCDICSAWHLGHGRIDTEVVVPPPEHPRPWTRRRRHHRGG